MSGLLDILRELLDSRKFTVISRFSDDLSVHFLVLYFFGMMTNVDNSHSLDLIPVL